jgi:hypothetical protein
MAEIYSPSEYTNKSKNKYDISRTTNNDIRSIDTLDRRALNSIQANDTIKNIKITTLVRLFKNG